MADIDNLKRQHVEIAELMGKLSSYTNNEEIKKETAQIQSILLRRVDAENKMLYPLVS